MGLRRETIDGEAYEFSMLDPELAMKTWVRIMKIGLGPFGSMLSKVTLKGGKVDIGDIDFDLSEALNVLSQRLDEDEVMALVKIMLETVRDKNSAPVVVAVQFMGRLGHMLKVVAKAVEVNYSDFFVAFGGLVKKLPVTSTQAKTVSTGKSGGSSSQK